MKMNKIKEKITLNPIMTLIILIGVTIVLSGFDWSKCYLQYC